jgi:hypothetical protein
MIFSSAMAELPFVSLFVVPVVFYSRAFKDLEPNGDMLDATSVPSQMRVVVIRNAISINELRKITGFQQVAECAENRFFLSIWHLLDCIRIGPISTRLRTRDGQVRRFSVTEWSPLGTNRVFFFV